MTNEKLLKANIKNEMVKKDINASELSEKTNINIIVLMLLLYCPLYKVKLSQSISICKALCLNFSDII